MLRNKIIVTASRWLPLFILLTLSNCGLRFSNKPGKIRSDVESYFKGNGREMYFIKPLKLKGPEGSLKVDFTFDSPDSLKLVRSNVSLFSDETLEPIDSLLITGTNKSQVILSTKKLTLMFKDNAKKVKEIRYFYLFSQKQLHELLENQMITILIYQGAKKKEFAASRKKWSRISNYLLSTNSVQH